LIKLIFFEVCPSLLDVVFAIGYMGHEFGIYIVSIVLVLIMTYFWLLTTWVNPIRRIWTEASRTRSQISVDDHALGKRVPLIHYYCITANGVVALVEEKFSVSLKLSSKGMKCWIVKEDGKTPRACAEPACIPCGYATSVVEPRSYLVVKVARSPGPSSSVEGFTGGVYASLLERESLERMVDTVGEEYSVWLQGSGEDHVFWRSHGALGWNGVHELVNAARSGGNEWVKQPHFAGVQPYAQVSWWTGVTNAAAFDHDGWAWLSCPSKYVAGVKVCGGSPRIILQCIAGATSAVALALMLAIAVVLWSIVGLVIPAFCDGVKLVLTFM
jgi:hypothetical protein